MIPKIIHYVWVGDQPKPELVYKCINSWKKYCPDFEIREWGNDSLLKISNRYVLQAIEHKKWAFVSDYIRLYALYNYGGLYLDSDCEITAPVYEFLKYSYVTGNEKSKRPITAFLGSEPANATIKDLLDEYNKLEMFDNTGEPDFTTNTERITKYFKTKYSLKTPVEDTEPFFFGENSVIFPSYYFCTPAEGKKNYAIHHFAYSWQTSFKRRLLLRVGNFKFVKFSQKIFPAKETLPLTENEKIVCKIHIGTRYFCITYTKSKVND